MKWITILLAMGVFAATCAKPQKPATDININTKVIQDCIKEMNITPDLEHLLETTDHNVPKKVKCHMKCVFEKFGDIHEGRITLAKGQVVTVTMGYLEEAQMNEIMGKCGSIKNDDECELAFLLHSCLVDIITKA